MSSYCSTLKHKADRAINPFLKFKCPVEILQNQMSLNYNNCGMCKCDYMQFLSVSA